MKQKKTASAAADSTEASSVTDLATIRDHVDAILDSYLLERTKKAKLTALRYGELWQALSDTVRGGGKRLRPYLMTLAYESYGNKTDDRVLRAAVGLELLHQAMLMHDDVIDRDYMRHGKPNVAGIFKRTYDSAVGLSEDDRLHLSHSAGILAGDLALAGAYELVRTSGLKHSDITMLHEMLNEAVFTVVGGELLDSEASSGDIRDTDVLSIAGLKTAGYSFIVPLVSGARLAGADEADIAVLRNLGWELGIAFQLTDDLLGAFGEATKTGKSITSDFEEGKHTYLMQYTYEKCRGEDRKTLEELLGKKDMSADEGDVIREILVKTGSKAACESLVAQHTTAAKTVLADLPYAAPHRQAFEALIHKVSNRNY